MSKFAFVRSWQTTALPPRGELTAGGWWGWSLVKVPPRIQRRCSGPYRPQVQGFWVPLRSYNEFYHLLKPPGRAPERAFRGTPDAPLKRGERIQHGPPELSTETQRATTWEMHNLDSSEYAMLYGLSAGCFSTLTRLSPLAVFFLCLIAALFLSVCPCLWSETLALHFTLTKNHF